MLRTPPSDSTISLFASGLAGPLAIGTLADVVTEHISAAILGGELKPGERLGEERVARALGVSRGPVREAARQLTERGLLVQLPRRGFFVRSFTVPEIDDLYDMRLAIERHALTRVLASGDPRPVISRLNSVLAQMSAAAGSGNVSEIARADLAFHRSLCEAAGNARLLKHFDELSAEVAILIGLIGRHYEAPAYLVATHKPIIAAIRRRNLAEALAAMDTHITEARDSMRRHFADPVPVTEQT